MLAGTIGSRPIGSPENARAREYIVDQLKLFGFDVRVQEADARRPEMGRTARVSNIIATLPGSRDEAIGIVSHYDSAAEAPGAADDALGVGVSLEAARVLASRAERNWTIFVLVTDGEEAALMGAAALMTDREVTRRLHAYLQVEASGSAGNAVLFEAGPGNGWLLAPWVAHAPHPRGGSFAIEIYKRLPNDTDFSIIKRHDIPGLNFAAVDDSYSYHTARDTPERLSPVTVRETGANIVSVVTALDRVDITQRTASDVTFFDIGRTRALSYGPVIGWVIAIVALILGIVAWVRLTAAVIRKGGLSRWLLTVIWTLAGAFSVFAAMAATTWALRAAREVYHPWYARPGRLFVLLLVVGTAVGWGMSRLGHWLPVRAHGVRHPIVAWTMALPAWLAIGAMSLWLTPSAAYLWILPLAAAAILLAFVPPLSEPLVRAASIVVLGISATLWLRNTADLLGFLVALLGRLPMITPFYLFAAVMCLAGVMIVPPFIATVAAPRPLLRPSLLTALWLLAIATSGGLAYSAPAYTPEEPLRRYVRALQQDDASAAVWEVASHEPGLDLAEGAPSGWMPQSSAGSEPLPRPRLPQPFVFSTMGPSLGPPPAAIASMSVRPVAAGVEMTVTAVPQQPGLWLSFVLPPGLTPSRHNLPGLIRLGRWTATYIAPPPEGVAFTASFGPGVEERLADLRVVVTSRRFPGGEGWQKLPSWLPQERTVWAGTASWVLTPIAPVPPLR